MELIISTWQLDSSAKTTRKHEIKYVSL